MDSRTHEVVIVGAGFAGLNAAKALKGSPANVTVVDRRNHYLFQPLLYQVATGGLSPADIATPIRGLLEKQRNARVVLGNVTGVDLDNRRVILSDGEVPYDTLVVATGSTHSYFGNEWSELAPGLKSLEDATRMRRRILLAFEAAERAESEEERKAWLTFVIVGGGPTGVELAGALVELARYTLKGEFRSVEPSDAAIYLIDATDRVLSTYDPRLSANAEKALERLGVTVMTGTLVTGVSEDGVTFKRGDDETMLPSKTVMWAAGVEASPLGRIIAEHAGIETDRPGRIKVEPDFTVPGHPEVFVVGDLANYPHQTGQPLRGTADVAQSEGTYVGRLIKSRLEGKEHKPYHFRDLGTLAVIGRSAAVADLRFIRLTGFIAWLAWLFVHLLKLVDFQNRITVLVQWGWNYITRNRSARLITGSFDSPFKR
ncbi:MAG: NAD(P)/FAD-dependent oxidoreductase [Dehalococcoidia bacterium]